jgi:threonine dehydrogenase-like Zn-dependent dehydrogenase
MALSAVRRGGRVLLVGLQAAPRAIDLHAMALREIELTSTLAHVCDTDIPEAIDILSRSNLAASVVDRVIGLDGLVEDGLLALAKGTARGKIVIDPRR